MRLGLNLGRARHKPDREALDGRPILFVDVDGVISLFGFENAAAAPGTWHQVEGIVHCIGHDAGTRLARLAERFEMVWATGWEERANEHLLRPLGIEPPGLPVLTFDGRAVFGSAHWKLEAIDEYAGDRPAAWIDDNLDHRCEAWARERGAPTLLVPTEPATGIEDEHVELLLDWAGRVAPRAEGAPGHGPGA